MDFPKIAAEPRVERFSIDEGCWTSANPRNHNAFSRIACCRKARVPFVCGVFLVSR